MRCDDIERWISKSMDNELSVKEVGQMRQHLEHCAPCRQSFEDSRDLRAWFVPGAAVAVPAGFAQRVVAEAFAGKASVPTFTPLKGGGASADSAMPGVDRFTVRLAAMAAALLAVLGLALYMQRSTQSRDLHADRNSLEDTLKGLEQLNQREFPARSQETPPEGTQR